MPIAGRLGGVFFGIIQSAYTTDSPVFLTKTANFAINVQAKHMPYTRG